MSLTWVLVREDGAGRGTQQQMEEEGGVVEGANAHTVKDRRYDSSELLAILAIPLAVAPIVPFSICAVAESASR